MHKKYSGDGLVAVSLSLDNPEDKQVHTQVDAFLTKQQAAMVNLISQGNPDDWYAKFKAGGLPLVFVFDRENRRVKKLEGGEVNYQVIESEVAELLKK